MPGLLDSIFGGRPISGGGSQAYRPDMARTLAQRGGTAYGGGAAFQGGWTAPPAPARGAGNAMQRPAGMPDFDWAFWQETAAANGMTGTTRAAGNPDTVTGAGDTITLPRGRGRPYVRTGAYTSLTVANGAQLTGSLSYGQDCNCHIQPFTNDPVSALLKFMGGNAVPFQEGEVLTGARDNANTGEQGCFAALLNYGDIGHPYPTSIEEVLRYSGISGKVKDIWTPIMTNTPSVTVTTGGAAITTGATGTRWLNSDSQYYIVGEQSHGLAGSSSGFLVFTGGMPEYLMARNNVIPYGGRAVAGFGLGPSQSFPYHAIGPFSSADVPIMHGLGTVAAATLHKLFIAQC